MSLNKQLQSTVRNTNCEETKDVITEVSTLQYSKCPVFNKKTQRHAKKEESVAY